MMDYKIEDITMKVTQEQLSSHLPINVEINIIHCKDCINFLNNHVCLHWSRHGTIETLPDDYCSYGEKI